MPLTLRARSSRTGIKGKQVRNIRPGNSLVASEASQRRTCTWEWVAMILLQHRKQAPGDAFKRQEVSWRRAYADAHSLRERFPAVEQLVAEMTFADAKALGIYSAQMRSFCPSAKAFFAIACPRTLCLEGGFDLDALIVKLIDARKTSASGTLQCAGWIEPSRSQHARCLLRLSYQIRVEYLEPAGKPAAVRDSARS
jgi:hypothetical protein